jgi:hypothetical protein
MDAIKSSATHKRRYVHKAEENYQSTSEKRVVLIASHVVLKQCSVDDRVGDRYRSGLERLGMLVDTLYEP